MLSEPASEQPPSVPPAAGSHILDDIDGVMRTQIVDREKVEPADRYRQNSVRVVGCPLPCAERKTGDAL